MSVFDEILQQFSDALKAWDFRSVLPSTWDPAKRGVLIVPRTPMDIIDNMLKEDPSGAAMTMPIISISPGQSDFVFSGMGGLVTNLSPTTHKPLYGGRIASRVIVSAWADQALGGEETVTRLGGEIYNCFVYNMNRLPSFRRLRPATADTAYEDQPQLWVFDTHVEGSAVMNYDGP